MIDTLLSLLAGGSTGIYAAVAGIIAVIGGVLTLYFKGRADAKAKAAAAQTAATLEAVKDATATRKDIANETDSALVDRISRPRKL